MMLGLISRRDWYPRPQLSSTPGEKPSATMSEMATSRFAIASPLGWRTLSEMPRLPGFLLLNWPPMSGSVTPLSGAVALMRASRPPIGAMAASRVSGWLLSSTLRHSAPNELRNRVPPADARNHVKSSTRIPSSANGLPRDDGLPALAIVALGSISGAPRGIGELNEAASSLSRGARRPGVQPVAVPIHFDVA